MRDHECGAPAHKVAQTLLDQRLRFRVQAGCGFVKNQDARVGQNGARNRDALLLPPGKFYAAFADDGIVFVLEGLREFIDARDMAGGENLFFRCGRPRKSHVFTDRAVEKKSFLQYDAELRAIRIQLYGGQVKSIHQDSAARRHIKCRNQPDDGRFSGTRRTDERRDRSRLRPETYVTENFLPRIVSEAHMFHFDFAIHSIERNDSPRRFIFELLV